MEVVRNLGATDSGDNPPKGKRSSKGGSLDPIEETPSGGTSTLLKNAFKITSSSGENEKDRRSSVFSLGFRRGNSDGEKSHPAMTWRKFMALFSLACLLAAAQIPLYLLGGSLGILPRRRFLTDSVYGCGYWRPAS
jgi:hypothetical protein